MTFIDAIDSISRIPAASDRERGARFERLMRAWLKAAPVYKGLLRDVWLWEDFPGRHSMGGRDLGIDLVAVTVEGEYWAVQCKLYGEGTTINKESVDSFLAHSGKTFSVDGQRHAFALRVWISTTEKWNANAELTIRNQQPPVIRIGPADLEAAEVDWEALLNGRRVEVRRKRMMEHQVKALEAAHAHFADHDRGQLIMACGTGKTFTSLKIMEQETQGKGLVLFLVPSIALLSQALNAWMADSECISHAICVCSDSKVNKSTSGDDSDQSVTDLALAATTNPEIVASRLRHYQDGGLTVVFSTYQSIDVVHEAQEIVLASSGGDDWAIFDLAVCDEAHRTTGVKSRERKDEAAFTRVHDAAFIKARKRLYMTATPRMYGEAAKSLAKEKEAMLWSMDDEAVFGRVFYRVNFSYAVSHGLLTDYKVMILSIPASVIGLPDEIRRMVEDPTNAGVNIDYVTKLAGCVCALSKKLPEAESRSVAVDPGGMRRALAFCQSIGSPDKPGTSKNVAQALPLLSRAYIDALPEDKRDTLVSVAARHVDGSMGAVERNTALRWLKETGEDNECRVVCNVRCLSEGVDVPALDAVIFLSPRRSEIDIVQAVGRVMRTFHKGQPDEKKFGYIIVPVVIQPDQSEDEPLSGGSYDVVWSILRALRAHDDRFNAIINQINLNVQKPDKIIATVLDGDWWTGVDETTPQLDNQIVRAIPGKLFDLRDKIFAHVVEKVGDRLYWDRWAQNVGETASGIVSRIRELIPNVQNEFDEYLAALRDNLNAGVDENQAIVMLAQFFITRPVFNALFANYDFNANNPVSRSLNAMLELLEQHGFAKDTAKLEEFYDSVRGNIGTIDNMGGRQAIIKNLYERFFAGAFQETVKALGIVYTPVECVDFILRSVEAIMRKEFGRSLSDENVHILDPFTGTGTFITRLLQSGIIRKEDMLRKYKREIHANELVLLAYYVADVNIETVFNSLYESDDYIPYDGICLTDTFTLTDGRTGRGKPFPLPGLEEGILGGNNELIREQCRTPIEVIVGNPPYNLRSRDFISRCVT